MYLQGVRFEDGHVASDPVLVRQRHEKLAGGVAIGSPPAFWYPKGHPYHRLFKSKAGTAVLNAMLQQMLVKEVTSPCIYRIGGCRRLLDNHPRLIMAITRSTAVMFTYCRRNTDKNTTTSLAKHGTGDVSAEMWFQLLQALLEEDFLEHPGRAAPGQQYDYAAHMDLVSLPMFFITGDKDFANAGAIKRFGYEGVSSHVKEYVNLPGYGHTDLLMGLTAEQDGLPDDLRMDEDAHREVRTPLRIISARPLRGVIGPRCSPADCPTRQSPRSTPVSSTSASAGCRSGAAPS